MKGTKKRKKNIAVLCILLIALLVFPLVSNISLSNMSIVISVLMYMYFASCWNIMGGYAGLFSLGNGIFIGLGAYFTSALYLYANITPWIGILIAALLTGLVSIAMGFPTFRLQSIYYSFATFALLNVMLVLFKNFDKIGTIKFGAAEGLRIIASGNDPKNMIFAGKTPYYYIILALLVLVLFISYSISKTKRGYYFRALSTNAGAAASLGVNVLRMKMEAQFISAFFSAIGGGFYAMFIRQVDPSKLFGSEMSINIMIMAVVGGANTLSGPILGAGVMYTINRLVTVYSSNVPGLANLIFGVILMAVIFVIPGGIVPFVSGIWKKRKYKKIKAGSGGRQRKEGKPTLKEGDANE